MVRAGPNRKLNQILDEKQKNKLIRIRAELARAIRTRADGAQIIETENSGRVAVVEIHLQGIIAHGVRGLRRKLGLEHRKQG